MSITRLWVRLFPLAGMMIFRPRFRGVFASSSATHHSAIGGKRPTRRMRPERTWWLWDGMIPSITMPMAARSHFPGSGEIALGTPQELPPIVLLRVLRA